MLYFINKLPLISLSTVQWTIENVISLISVFLVGVGGVLALLQWRSASKVKRAEFVNQMIEKLRFDQDMVNIMRRIEHSEIPFDGYFFRCSDGTEAQIDNFLSYLSFICYLRTLGVIQKKEFAFFEFYLCRVFGSASLCKYLGDSDRFAKQENKRSPFQFLVDYGIENNFVDKGRLERLEPDKYSKN